jgi:hypothetical protein
MAVVLVSTTMGRVGLAQTEPNATDDGVRLEYQAPPGCPDAGAFRAEFHAKNRRLRAGKTVAGDVSVVVTQEGPRASGRLVIRIGGQTGTREFEAASCGEVIAALALVTALDLDAAPTSPMPSSSSSLAEDIPPESPPVRPPPKSAPRGHLAVGAHASMTNGVSDGLLFGAPVFLDFSAETKSLFSPSARVSFEGTVSGQVAEAVGALRFTSFMGAIEGCPLRLGPAAIEVRPCIRAEAGALAGSPEGVSFGHEVTKPWVSVGAVARLAWAPTRMIFLEIEGGARVPIVRPEFVFLPHLTLYQVPVASALVETGLGVRFY